jgi:hypothetical protein
MNLREEIASLMFDVNQENLNMLPRNLQNHGVLKFRMLPLVSRNLMVCLEIESVNVHQVSSTYSFSESVAQDELSAPELSGLVHRLEKRPIFEGTYSSVFAGQYDGKKVNSWNTHREIIAHPRL